MSADITDNAINQSVSVIIPVFADWDKLGRCLECLAQQTVPATDFEIIVIDNGRHPSQQRKQALEARSANIRYAHEPKPGSYSARNTGISISRHEILAFTDSDCLPEPKWLKNAVNSLIKEGKNYFVGGRVEVTTATANATITERYDQHFAFQQQRYIKDLSFAVTANLVAWKSSFEKTGLFRDDLYSGGDLEWGRRATNLGFKPFFCHNAVVHHPARQKLGKLAQQAARVAGGTYMLDRAKLVPAPKPLPLEVIYHCLPPLWPVARLLFDQRVSGGLPLTTRLGFAWVKCVLHFSKGLAYVRCVLGLPAERR